jgi:hypothetical protein
VKRDIPGQVLGVFLFLVVSYFAFALYGGFGKSVSGEVTIDPRGSQIAALYMKGYVWLPAAVATLIYYLLFRARFVATIVLGVVAGALYFLVAETNVFEGGSLRTALFVWTGFAAAFAHHAAVWTMRQVFKVPAA